MTVRILGLACAVLLIAAGAFLTFYGLGGADSRQTSRSWATLGPLLGGFGVALVIVTLGKSK